MSTIVSANGLPQEITCSGSGPMTLVVIPGLNAGIHEWASITPELARVTRTCVYDRPGIGGSPVRARLSTATAKQHATELQDLLSAAGEQGTYLVLGHSYGGLIARSFVHLFPKEVNGLLLMEGVDPGGHGDRYWHEAGQQIDVIRSRAQAGRLKQLTQPLIVLSASQPNGDHLIGPRYRDTLADIAQWRAQQAGATRLSSDSIQVIAQSGHVVQQDNPKATVAAVRTLMDAAVSGSPLQCGPEWPRLHASCAGGSQSTE